MKAFAQMAFRRVIAPVAVLVLLVFWYSPLQAQDLTDPAQATKTLQAQIELLQSQSAELYGSGAVTELVRKAYHIQFAQTVLENILDGQAVEHAISAGMPSEPLRFSSQDGEVNAGELDIVAIGEELKAWARMLLAK